MLKQNVQQSLANDRPVNDPAVTLQLQPHVPLWQRAPTRDNEGKPYADFMMLIPGLRNFNPVYQNKVIATLEQVLSGYAELIVMADLNLKINVLWVTTEARAGLTAEIAACIHHLVPEAKLVSQHQLSE